MAERGRYTARNVKETRAELARVFSGQEFWYANTRGLHNFENGVDQGYLSYLPSFEGFNFEAIVDNLITHQPSSPVNVLDVGCGEGNFLKDCLRKWGRDVRGFGVDLRPGTQERGLDIRSGDVNDLVKIFPPNSMDLVTSVRTLEYTADPWQAIKRMHRILKPGGIALLSYVPFNMNKSGRWRDYKFDSNGAKSLIDYLKAKYGMEAQIIDDEFCNLSFRKTTDKLWLPLSYGNTVFNRQRILSGFDSLQFTTLGYRFRPIKKGWFKKQ